MKQRLTGSTLAYYRSRYKPAKRNKKSEILDYVCDLYGYTRKAATRLLNDVERDRYGKPKPGRHPVYHSTELKAALQQIWLCTDQMGSRRLKKALPLWLPHYAKHYGELNKQVYQKLLSISASSIDRLLQPERVKIGRRGLSGTRPGSLLKNQIPIKTDHWDVTKPGFVEADTVAHCGNSLSGDFVWSVTLTDICSGWTEIRATWNKGAAGVVEQIKDIEINLPFDLFGFDCDNGSEFLNYHLLRYFTERSKVIEFTRSRPYKKNDNAHVEQKNWTHVRQLFGYDRLCKFSMVAMMNDLYKNEWSLLQNYFCPNTKLISKIKINSKYIKKYDKEKTPYERVMSSHDISNKKKKLLKETYLRLDPFELKKSVEKKLKNIFELVDLRCRPKNRVSI